MRILLTLSLLIALLKPPMLLAADCCDSSVANNQQTRISAVDNVLKTPCQNHNQSSDAIQTNSSSHNDNHTCQCSVGVSSICMSDLLFIQAKLTSQMVSELKSCAPLRHHQPPFKPPIIT